MPLLPPASDGAWIPVFPSVVVPTYNRLPILRQCLQALAEQDLSGVPGIDGYEVVVVDDGSTDQTVACVRRLQQQMPHLRLLAQAHGGPARARNRGVEAARGDLIVFIDSDLVVRKDFLAGHVKTLRQHWQSSGNRLCFTYGPVINTANFADPTAEPHKPTDLSWAYFATGNVAIDRSVLIRAGLFDPGFSHYGWEDLELGERLRQLGVCLVRCPGAAGYHWHPPFHLQQIPALIRQEEERARMAHIFLRKHPSWRVRMITQFSWIHRLLWELLTLGGVLNEDSLRPLLAWLIRRGHPGLALEILRLPLNHLYVQALFHQGEG